MPSIGKRTLLPEEVPALLLLLKNRFEKYPHRHPGVQWEEVEQRLLAAPDKMWSLQQMEETGGEPDVVGKDLQTGAFLFFDCAPESPAGRRSICYDPEALASRKANKPPHSAVGMAAEMGITLLSESQYMTLQQLGKFDTKTSSWLLTPSEIRKAGGAIFGDWRFGRTFIYHNGAESWYGARGFRGFLQV